VQELDLPFGVCVSENELPEDRIPTSKPSSSDPDQRAAVSPTVFYNSSMNLNGLAMTSNKEEKSQSK
jgi:hypothetical protein